MTKFFNFSFKNRIAFSYLLSGAFLIALVFIFILQTVKFSVNQHINEEIKDELFKHLDDVTTDKNDTYLIQVDQWRAREHNSISVNPVFVQFYDNNKKLIDKSPNLKTSDLVLQNSDKNDVFINSTLNQIPIRQIQKPILNDKNVVGYLVVAMSLEDFEIVDILKNILLISYPIILLVLFLFARFFAGKSIQPVSSIITISNKITKDNLSERIPLPSHKDELYYLSETINSLLNRIQNAIEREKKFTSDASHELRTPLAIIKGTLEVLIRKPREKQEYEDKVNFCIREVDRVNKLVDQLLLLARFENQKHNIKQELVYVNALILDTLTRFSLQIKEKKMVVKTNFTEDFYINSDNYLLSIIFSNIISNAIKYAGNEAKIQIEVFQEEDKISCIIQDNGIGINPEDLKNIYNSFYRSNVENHPEIKGNGIGLSIVKRISDLLHIPIEISSVQHEGTTVKIRLS
jgi:signal transduction histidine kinase